MYGTFFKYYLQRWDGDSWQSHFDLDLDLDSQIKVVNTILDLDCINDRDFLILCGTSCHNWFALQTFQFNDGLLFGV